MNSRHGIVVTMTTRTSCISMDQLTLLYRSENVRVRCTKHTSRCRKQGQLAADFGVLFEDRHSLNSICLFPLNIYTKRFFMEKWLRALASRNGEISFSAYYLFLMRRHGQHLVLIGRFQFVSSVKKHKDKLAFTRFRIEKKSRRHYRSAPLNRIETLRWCFVSQSSSSR